MGMRGVSTSRRREANGTDGTYGTNAEKRSTRVFSSRPVAG
jgi:hypothetical protein